MISVMQDVALDTNGRWIKCVLNAKFLAFHTNFRKYLNLRTSENFQTSENFKKNLGSKLFFFKEFILTKMFFLTIFFKEFSIAFKTITLY